MVALLLSACSLTSAAAPGVDAVTLAATLPALRAVTLSSPVPMIAQVLPTPAPTTTPPPVPMPDVYAACGTDPHALTQHNVIASMDYASRQIGVRHTLTTVNHDSAPLTDFVLNVAAAGGGDESFTLHGLLRLDGDSARELAFVSQTERRLYMELDTPVPPGCPLKLELAYTVQVPQIAGGVGAFDGYFGYSPRQVNLGHWLASVAPRLNGQWVTRQAMFVGEQDVVAQADWALRFTLNNAPDDLVLAAPGIVTQAAPGQWQITHAAARDLTLSLCTGCQVLSLMAETGTTVEVYSFDDAQQITGSGLVDGARHALNMAMRALEHYSAQFGPYPYERLLVIQGDFPDGMEFSGLIFVSTAWFREYNGDPAAYLTLITVHEVAHQWWYLRVGNDPALAPWLDEALATYSEYLYLETYYPELAEWWWAFRVDSHAPTGFVDSSVYEFDSIRAYINAVYLRGVEMLHYLRADLGDTEFMGLLRAYAESGEGRIAAPADFWGLLSPQQLNATRVTRELYFRDEENLAPESRLSP